MCQQRNTIRLCPAVGKPPHPRIVQWSVRCPQQDCPYRQATSIRFGCQAPAWAYWSLFLLEWAGIHAPIHTVSICAVISELNCPFSHPQHSVRPAPGISDWSAACWGASIDDRAVFKVNMHIWTAVLNDHRGFLGATELHVALWLSSEPKRRTATRSFCELICLREERSWLCTTDTKYPTE